MSVSIPTPNPTSIQPGGSTVLRITLANSNQTVDITNVSLGEILPGMLPDGLKIATTTSSYTCFEPVSGNTIAGSGVLTATAGQQAITLSGGVIPMHVSGIDGSCSIDLPVSAGTTDGSPTGYEFYIELANVQGNKGANLGINPADDASQTVQILSLGQPTIDKSFSQSELVWDGGTATLTITVSNSNTMVDIPNFNITDVFPTISPDGAIIEVTNAAGAVSDCDAGGTPAAFMPVNGDTSLTATGGTVPASGSCWVSVDVAARKLTSVYSSGSQANTIDAVTQFSNDIGIRAQQDASDNITVKSPLRVGKSFSASSLAHGQSGVLTITLFNDSNTDIGVTSFQDSPIDGMGMPIDDRGLIIAPMGVSTTCGGMPTVSTVQVLGDDRGVLLESATIPANGSCTVTVNFTATTQVDHVPVTYTNTISDTAVVNDAGVKSNGASDDILVADTVRVLKSRNTDSPRPGNPVQYQITVQNWTDSDYTHVDIQDELPVGMTFLTGTINGNDFDPVLSGDSDCNVFDASGNMLGDTSVHFDVETVRRRFDVSTPGKCVLTFYAMTDPTGANTSTANAVAPNSVCIDEVDNNPVTTFCNGSGPTTTNSPVDPNVLTVAKAFSPGGPLEEGTVTRMTITLSNYSVNPLTAVNISDNLPTSTTGGVQMVVADPPVAISDCGSPTVTAAKGTTTVFLLGGTVPARANLGAGSPGSCTLAVNVVGPAGNYDNTASAEGTETFADSTTNAVMAVTGDASLAYDSVLSATKEFSPSAINVGGVSTVRVRLANSGTVELNNVRVTDPLPASMALASPTNAYSTCNGPITISGNPGDTSISMTGASIAGGNGNCDLLFDVTASASGNLVNSILAGNIEAVGTGVINQTAVTGILNVGTAAGAELSVNKTTTPPTLTFPGQTSRMDITIGTQSQAVTGLTLTDWFTDDGSMGGSPNGMVLTPSPAPSTTCPGGVVSAQPGDSSVTLSGASLAAGSTCTFSVNVSLVRSGTAINRIPVGAIGTDQGLTNVLSATTSLATQTNLGLVKQFINKVVKPGERSRLRLTIYNPASQVATNLAVLDTMPSGLLIPAGANPMTTCIGATVTAPQPDQVQVSGGSLGPASGSTPATCYAEIDVVAAAEGDYFNEIPAGDLTALVGGIPSSNALPADNTLLVKNPIVVHKAIGGFTLDAGNPGAFNTGTGTRAPGTSAPLVIRLENPNATTLTHAAFSDALPTGLVVASTPGIVNTCGGTVSAAPSATAIALAGGIIPATGACEVTVNVLSNIPGTYLNEIPSGAVTSFEGVKNEEASRADIIISFPPTVGKEFAPAVIPPGGTSTLTIAIGNENPAVITLSSAFTDAMPTGVTVSGSPGGTCGGTPTWTASSVTLAKDVTIPAGGCAISVAVTSSTPGEHNNNIPAGALQTSVGANQQAVNSPLIVSTKGYVSGKVFRDNNVTPNGTFELGTDTPIAGVTIELRSGANCSGAVVGSMTTDAQGSYLFHGLNAGTYSACEPGQPTGTVNGISTAGSIVQINLSGGSAGTASNPTATSSQVVNIVLGENGSGEVSGSPNNNFAELVLSSITGTVFMDYNNNGLQNGPDTGIAGQTIELFEGANCSGTSAGTRTTDGNGDYSFTGLQPGTYSVCQLNQPADTSNGITTPGTVGNGGTPGTASGVAVLPSLISGIVLPPGTASPDNDFAEIPNSRTLSGMVFFDYDNSGTLDGNDYGITGQTLDLTGTDSNGNTVTRQTTTQADGSYMFTGLPEGTYKVNQPNQPANTSNGKTLVGSTGGSATSQATTPSMISAIDLSGVNKVSGDNDFAEIPDAGPDLTLSKTHTPSGFGEGSSTSSFVLTPGNIGTMDSGGTITVVDTLPAGMTVAAPATGVGWSCGGAVGAATVSCTSNSVIPAGGTGQPITLRVAVDGGLAGQLLTNTATVSGGAEPAGFNGNNSASDTVAVGGVARVSGAVWQDADHNRIPGAGELRLADWTVELLLNGIVVATTTSGADGTYAFENLSPGSGYRILFRHPHNGVVWGHAVANEQGIAPAQGTRDDPMGPVSSNGGNPAGAVTGDGTLQDLTLYTGDNIVEQSLPVDPSGVVYSSSTRLPLAGVTVTLDPQNCQSVFDPDKHLVGGAGGMSQITGADGYYGFWFISTAPQCDYTLVVTQSAGYQPPPSAIAPTAGPLMVPAGPGTTMVQSQSTAPAQGDDTTYYFSFSMSGGSQSVVNNHIPLDAVRVVPALPRWALVLLSLLLAFQGYASLRGRRYG